MSTVTQMPLNQHHVAKMWYFNNKQCPNTPLCDC